jgi:prepilin-type N-terminal cleavage/methylation domain-containing protein
MRRRASRQSGFTLVEAVIVLAIIGIIVAISIPNLRRSRMRASMLGVVRTFEQAVAVCRINAIKRGNNVCLRIVADGSRQHLTEFHAWIDANANEIEDGGDELVGAWQLDNADEWSFQESADANKQMYVLNASGGGTARGFVFLPNGMAQVEAATQVGIGQGAFEYFIWYDARKWNTFELSVFGGAGTVQTLMWDPGASAYDTNFAHWEYY